MRGFSRSDSVTQRVADGTAAGMLNDIVHS